MFFIKRLNWDLPSQRLFQMTGRKGRVVSNDDGSITYETRSELDVPVEILNLTEKQRFMDGEKVNTVTDGTDRLKRLLFVL